ncbi:MAG: hypothetical protein EOP37_28495 [Rubrivivax sp.]|nr:MAG: hypothetical protein EOP37_28495 [Rubrivivax sp.]
MHSDNEQTTPVTFLHQYQQQHSQQQQSNFALVVHRLDDHAAKLEKLDEKIEKLDAKMHAKYEKLDAKIEKLDAKMDALRNDMQANLETFRKDMKADMREVVSAAMAPVNERFNTVEGRIKHAATAADNKLLRWCAGSAAGSSGLAYLMSRLLS